MYISLKDAIVCGYLNTFYILCTNLVDEIYKYIASESMVEKNLSEMNAETRIYVFLARLFRGELYTEKTF